MLFFISPTVSLGPFESSGSGAARPVPRAPPQRHGPLPYGRSTGARRPRVWPILTRTSVDWSACSSRSSSKAIAPCPTQTRLRRHEPGARLDRPGQRQATPDADGARHRRSRRVAKARARGKASARLQSSCRRSSLIKAAGP